MDRREPLSGEPVERVPPQDPAIQDLRERAGSENEVEVTRVEIERTRADMSETADAIQRRLSPENLKEQAKDRVRDATVGRVEEAGSGITETIKENPVPWALTGIGLGWLLVNARRKRAEQPSIRRRPYYDYPPRYYEEREPDGPSAGRQALERTRDRVGETAHQTRERVGETAAQVRDKSGEIADRTQDRAGRLAERAQHQARRAGGGLQRVMRENPLTTGALAVGFGAAVGLAIPETRKEHEVMGEARDNVVEKAQEKAQEAQEKVQRVAQEAQGAAREEAQNQGLAQE